MAKNGSTGHRVRMDVREVKVCRGCPFCQWVAGRLYRCALADFELKESAVNTLAKRCPLKWKCVKVRLAAHAYTDSEAP